MANTIAKFINWIRDNIGSGIVYAASFVAGLQGVFQIVHMPPTIAHVVSPILVLVSAALIVAERIIQYLKLPVHTIIGPAGQPVAMVRAKRRPTIQ